MATYKLITNTVLSSQTNTVTMSSVSQDYYDLILRVSTQGTAGGWNYINLRFNGNTSTVYGVGQLKSNGSSVTSGQQSSQASALLSENSIPNISYNNRSQIEYYIAGYTNVATIPILGVAMGSRASSTQYASSDAARYGANGPVTSITLLNLTSNFEVGSTFRLYGVKL